MQASVQLYLMQLSWKLKHCSVLDGDVGYLSNPDIPQPATCDLSNITRAVILLTAKIHNLLVGLQQCANAFEGC